jgi:hypothetical protein
VPLHVQTAEQIEGIVKQARQPQFVSTPTWAD